MGTSRDKDRKSQIAAASKALLRKNLKHAREHDDPKLKKYEVVDAQASLSRPAVNESKRRMEHYDDTAPAKRARAEACGPATGGKGKKMRDKGSQVCLFALEG